MISKLSKNKSKFGLVVVAAGLVVALAACTSANQDTARDAVNHFRASKNKSALVMNGGIAKVAQTAANRAKSTGNLTITQADLAKVMAVDGVTRVDASGAMKSFNGMPAEPSEGQNALYTISTIGGITGGANASKLLGTSATDIGTGVAINPANGRVYVVIFTATIH